MYLSSSRHDYLLFTEATSYMAEEGRLELPRRITPTYKFSKLAPSPTWVLLQIIRPSTWTGGLDGPMFAARTFYRVFTSLYQLSRNDCLSQPYGFGTTHYCHTVLTTWELAGRYLTSSTSTICRVLGIAHLGQYGSLKLSSCATSELYMLLPSYFTDFHKLYSYIKWWERL